MTFNYQEGNTKYNNAGSGNFLAKLKRVNGFGGNENINSSLFGMTYVREG